MCLIIDAPKGSSIPDRLIESASRYNRDGWGVMWHADKVTRVKRSLDMHALPKFIKKLGNVDRIIHLRLGTHGNTDLQNCHPFKVGSLYFMHNGIMGQFGNIDKTKSDSAYFAEHVIKPIEKPGILAEYHFRVMMEQFCRDGQKFAFMDDEGYSLHSGSWSYDKSNGIFLSNQSMFSYGEVYGRSSCGWSGHSDSAGKLWSTPYDQHLDDDWEDYEKSRSEADLRAAGLQLKKDSKDTMVIEYEPSDDYDDDDEDVVDDSSLSELHEQMIEEGEFGIREVSNLPFDEILSLVEQEPRTVAKMIKYANC